LIERLKPSDLQLLSSRDLFRYYSFNAHERNCLFLNLGGRRFVETGYAMGIDVDLEGRGVAVLDLDEDGGLDLVVRSVARRKLSVFHNEIGSEVPTLRVKLVGTKSNRDAVGAIVSVRTGSITQTRVRSAGSGFQGQSEATLHFGLGRAQLVDELKIRWPSGLTERFTEIGPNAVVEILEGEGRLSTRRLRGSRTVRGKSISTRATPWTGWTLSGTPWHPLPGVPTLVALSASWCPGCAKEVATLNELHAKFSPQLRVIGVALDDQATTQLWAKARGARYEVVRATGESIFPLVQRFFGEASLPLPTTLLLDANGRVLRLYTGPVSQATIERALAHLDIHAAPDPSPITPGSSFRLREVSNQRGGAVER
jgi:peroxiredoxin